MDDKFESLRGCIYTNESELKRFRQLVVNVVLATDIFDKELSALRKNRWSKAFSDPTKLGANDADAAVFAASAIFHDESHVDQVNRKATIVLEHLIQASDVSHTMQHFDIYRKWNERLFYEMYSAYRSGRTETDPSVGWYGGELWFFDNYVIPLAKKLRECGVFGVSSDECLNYATENRRLWAERGEQIVQELLETDYIARLRRKPHRGKRRVRSKDLISDGL
jgi:3'5'-cyclic nucleotide phosphodiesterase